MDYKYVIRYQPELRFVNINNISIRMLKLTRGDLFVAYNVIKGAYELHSIENYKLNGMSYNTSIDKEMLNGFIYNDYKANNLKAFLFDVKDNREKRNFLYDRAEEERLKRLQSLDVIERTIGTKV